MTHLWCELSLQCCMAVLVMVSKVQSELLLLHGSDVLRLDDRIHCVVLVISLLCVQLVIITGDCRALQFSTAVPALITALPRPGIVTLRHWEKIIRQDHHQLQPAALQQHSSSHLPSNHHICHIGTQPCFYIFNNLHFEWLSPVPIGLALDIEMSWPAGCRNQLSQLELQPGPARKVQTEIQINERTKLLIQRKVRLLGNRDCLRYKEFISCYKNSLWYYSTLSVLSNSKSLTRVQLN